MEDVGFMCKPQKELDGYHSLSLHKPKKVWKFPLIYKSDNSRDSLYEEHGATLKHKCGKRIVTLPLLSFSLIFLWALWPLFLFGLLWPLVRSLIMTCGGIIVSIILSSLGQCSNNDDHHTFIYLQLNIRTRYLEQRYDSIWMPLAVYQDVQWSSVAKDIKKWTSHEISC